MKTQWQTYQELELLPLWVAEPPKHDWKLVRPAAQLWHASIHRSTERQIPAQQVEHLEHCLALKLVPPTTRENWWAKSWSLLTQTLTSWGEFTGSDPYIWHSSDQTGQTWWHTYHPQTGRRIDFESEDEVCVWIEESFYR